MSSISPIEAKQFAERIKALEFDYVDAPVSGGEVDAKAASLTIMVGASEGAFEKVEPLLEPMGKNITLVGKNGAGQTRKVANQIIVALNIEAVAEVLLFAAKMGTDPAKIRQALIGGFTTSRVHRAFWKCTVSAWLSARSIQVSESSCTRRTSTFPIQRPCHWRFAAKYCQSSGTVQCLRRPWRQGMGPLRDGSRVGEIGQ